MIIFTGLEATGPLPTPSVDSATKLCCPPETGLVGVQLQFPEASTTAVQTSFPFPSTTLIFEPASPVPVNSGVWSVVVELFAGKVIVGVVGGVVSIFKLTTFESGETFPKLSVAVAFIL